ncbi:MAG: response regulator [bacterium]|nr:response regulator [bacterium]
MMSYSNTLKVLIADDEPGMRSGIARALEGLTVTDDHSNQVYSLDVTFATDGLEARNLLTSKNYDLLLLDHGMPEITGMEILEQLQASEAKTIVIMITAYASLDMAVKATKQGAFDFLAKPFTPQELKKVVVKAARHLLVSRTAEKLALEKRKVRFEFISILAHELKAPLGAVEGYLRLLEEGITDNNKEATDRIVRRSLVRIEGMRKLILDLLDLTRIESGEKKRVLEKVNPADVAQIVVETFTPQADSRQISVSLSCDGDTTMMGDNSELEIILNNMISNAVKYNRDGGQVQVNIQGDTDIIKISVIDTGIGMSESEVSRLFGEFVRIKNDKTRLIEGSGLGLSILRRLVILNGGDVNVQSQPDEGTNFTVTLSRTGMVADDSSQGKLS